MYVKIGNKYYPRMSPNWSRFRNAIIYGNVQIYYRDIQLMASNALRENG